MHPKSNHRPLDFPRETPFFLRWWMVFFLILISSCTQQPNPSERHSISPTVIEFRELPDSSTFKQAQVEFQKPQSENIKTIDQALWVKLQFGIKNKQYYALEVPNPNIDYIAIYQPDSSIQKPIYVWGDELKVSQQSNSGNYPIKGLDLQTGDYTLYLKYIHKGRFFHGSVLLTPQRIFVKQYAKQSGKFGIFVGICLFILLLSSTLGVLLKRRILLFYFIWSLSQISYFLVSTGFLRLIFYPEVAEFNSILRACISQFAPLTLLWVIYQYMEAPKRYPKITRILGVFSAIIALLISYALLLPDLFWEHVHFWLNFLLVCMLILYTAPLILFIVFAKRSPWKVMIAFTSYSLHLIAGFYLIKLEYSNIQYHYLNEIERLSWLPLAELVIMAIGLGAEITRTIREKNQLLTENLQLQLKASEIHVNAIEAERKRIASDLHDHILNRMDILSMLTPSQKNSRDEISEMIKAVAADIRNLAYEIHPPWIQQQKLEDAIRAEIQNFQKVYNIPIAVAFYDWKQEPGISAKTHILRITQEFLQNSQKHAQASQIYINFFQRDNQYELDFEDDGKGYPLSQKPSGLGISNVLARVQMMQGKIHIDSLENQGVHWLIEIPLEEPTTP